MPAAAGQCEEVVCVMAAVAGWAFGDVPGDTEEDLVRHILERHGGFVMGSVGRGELLRRRSNQRVRYTDLCCEAQCVEKNLYFQR